jgi:hypothetical protein
VNFINTKINISALSLIKKEESKNLNIVCFFAVKNKIRIAVVNPESVEVQVFID